MVKKITNSLLVLTFGSALMFVGSAVAQNADPSRQPVAGPGVSDPGHPRVNQVDSRLENQKHRIQQGLKNGTLTKEQAHHLWQNDRRVANQERRELAANGGHLTKSEQRQMNHELNRNSRNIYHQKHN